MDALAPARPDVFLTPRMPGVGASGLAGLWPVSEWRLGRDGGREELKRFCHDTPGTALGFLSYHAGFTQLGLSLPAPDFPGGVFRKYAAVVSPAADGKSVFIRAQDARMTREIVRMLDAVCFRKELPPFPGGVRASLEQEAFEAAVERARDHILAGDVYQLNLSMRFETGWPGGLEPGVLFTELMRQHPAMFYALFKDGPRSIISTSPERFLRVRGGRVLSQPIKGTAKAGRDSNAAMEALRASPKEDAELSMIVDLIRNDISANCEYGSVAVQGHKSVFEVDGLLQMYASVTGRLKRGATALDLLWEALPPGSVTGCPKRRAVEIIARLEPHHREFFCGCLVMVHGPGDLDSSVVIRTGMADETSGRFRFYAGSGVVVDSVPGLEYEETMAKAAKFLKLVGRRRA